MFWRGENRDDLELVAKFKATGESQYFAGLFHRYQKRVFFIARSFFDKREAAEDLVQETFVRAFEQIAGFDERNPGSSFYAWLCRICRNACLDELRKLQVRASHQRAEPALASLEPAVAEERRDYRAQELTVIYRQLDEELARVPEQRRACWLLFYVEGYSYREIASLTRLGFEEVKVNIQAVNRLLRRKFK